MTARLDGKPRADKGKLRKYATEAERDEAQKLLKKATHKRYRERHKAKLTEKHLAYRAANPDVARRAAIKHYWKNRAKIFAKRFGVTEAEILALPDACEICGSRERLCVDHCHSVGHVRGALCNACNLALGYMGDDPARLRAAAAYIVDRSKLSEPQV